VTNLGQMTITTHQLCVPHTDKPLQRQKYQTTMSFSFSAALSTVLNDPPHVLLIFQRDDMKVNISFIFFQ